MFKVKPWSHTLCTNVMRWYANGGAFDFHIIKVGITQVHSWLDRGSIYLPKFHFNNSLATNAICASQILLLF